MRHVDDVDEMSNRRTIAGIVICTAAAVAFVGFQLASVTRKGVQVGVKRAAAACTEKGHSCLPHLTLLDTDGTAWPPESLVGKVVMVNVWATWCRPCQIELPDLAETYEKYRSRGFVLLGVLTDEPSDGALRELRNSIGMTYPVVRADGELLEALEYPDALPTTFIYDRSGRLKFSHRGPLTASQLGTVLDELM